MREKRLNDLLRDEIGGVISKEVEFSEGVLVTVIGVAVSKGFKDAKVFVSVLPLERGEEAIGEIKKRLPYLRALLKKRMRLRFIPNMYIILDQSEEKAARIEEVLSGI